MLPARHRLTLRREFADTVRRGRRAARGSVVLHAQMASSTELDPLPLPMIGLVVSRSVGGAVTRHRVSRRLRHVMSETVEALPDGVRIVIRAQPTAATASSEDLRRDCESALRRLDLLRAPVSKAQATADRPR